MLWDEGEQRGLLVNGTSALLHLLRASLHHSRSDKFKSLFMLKSTEELALKEPTIRYRHDSAHEVLLEDDNRKVRLYTRKEESYDETVARPGGECETVMKTVTTYTTVEDRVEELYDILQQIVDHEAYSDKKGISVNLGLHDRILGWDFRDVAVNRDPLYPRVAKATNPPLGTNWRDLAKSTHAVTFFGLGFGDILKPVRSEAASKEALSPFWHSMPTGEGLLGVGVSDLRDIIVWHGDGNTKPPTLCTGLTWRNPQKQDPFEEPKGRKWNPVQLLVPTKSLGRRRPLPGDSGKAQATCDIDNRSHRHGAVIIGPSYPWSFAGKLTVSPGHSSADIHDDDVRLPPGTEPREPREPMGAVDSNRDALSPSEAIRDSSSGRDLTMDTADMGPSSPLHPRSESQSERDYPCSADSEPGALPRAANGPSRQVPGIPQPGAGPALTARPSAPAKAVVHRLLERLVSSLSLAGSRLEDAALAQRRGGTGNSKRWRLPVVNLAARLTRSTRSRELRDSGTETGEGS